MTTLSDNLFSVPRLEFVGREEEMNLFRETVLAKGRRKLILCFHGAGGVGKTTLVERLQQIGAIEGIPNAKADLKRVGTPEQVLQEWSQSLAVWGIPFTAFYKTWSDLVKIDFKLRRNPPPMVKGLLNAAQKPYIGAFLITAFGEERFEHLLGSRLGPHDHDKYVKAADLLTEAFIADIQCSKTRHHALILDTFEQASSALDAWLLTSLLPRIKRSTIVVSGHNDLRVIPQWHEWVGEIVSQRLNPFTSKETDKYAFVKGITNPESSKQLYEITKGMPWALKLAVDAATQNPAFLQEDPSKVHSTFGREAVINRLLRQVTNPAQRDLLCICAVLDTFDLDLLEKVADKTACQEFQSTRIFTSIWRSNENGYSLLDPLRDILYEEFRRDYPERVNRLHKTAANELITKRISHTADTNKRQFLLKTALYHLAATDLDDASAVFQRAVCFEFGLFGRTFFDELFAILRRSPYQAQKELELTFCSAFLEYIRGSNDLSLQYFNLVRTTAERGTPYWFFAGAAIIDILHRRGETTEAFTIAKDTVNRALNQTYWGYAAVLAARAAEMAGVLGKLDDSIRFCAIAEEHLNSADDVSKSNTHLLLADVYLFRGNLDIGLNHARRALACYDKLQDLAGKARSQITLSWGLYLIGEVREAEAVADGAIAFYTKSQDSYHNGLAQLNLAEALRRTKDVQKAIAINRAALDYFEEVHSTLYKGHAIHQLALCYEASGELDKARDNVLEALKAHVQSKEHYSIGMAHLSLARIYSKLGEKEKATETIKTGRDYLISAHNPKGYYELVIEELEHTLRSGNINGANRQLGEIMEKALTLNHADLTAKVLGMQFIITFISNRDNLEKQADIQNLFIRALGAALSHNSFLLDSLVRWMVTLMKPLESHIDTAFIRLCSSASIIWHSKSSDGKSEYERECARRIKDNNPECDIFTALKLQK